MTIRRREFLASISAAVAASAALARQGNTNGALRSFLQPHVLQRSSLDQFLDPKAQVWARFDPELGYLLRNAFVRDGVDGFALQYQGTTMRLPSPGRGVSD